MTEQTGRLLSDVQMDRLVDGELSEQEYRAILAALDVEPGGWRRCALAFLEAQALRKELPPLYLDVEAPAPSAQPAVRSYRMWSHAAAMLLASAATLMVAVGLQPDRFGETRTAPRIANEPQAGNIPAFAAQNLGGMPDSVIPEPMLPAEPLGRITLISGGRAGAGREIQVPALPLDNEVAFRVLESEAPVPWEIERALRRLGYEVYRDRQWAPVDAGNRQVYVPLEQVEIKPVANFAY